MLLVHNLLIYAQYKFLKVSNKEHQCIFLRTLTLNFYMILLYILLFFILYVFAIFEKDKYKILHNKTCKRKFTVIITQKKEEEKKMENSLLVFITSAESFSFSLSDTSLQTHAHSHARTRPDGKNFHFHANQNKPTHLLRTLQKKTN